MPTKASKIYQIVELRQSGLSYQKIGRLFSLSRERIRQIVNKHNQSLSNIKLLLQIIEGSLNHPYPVDKFIFALEFDRVNRVLLQYYRRKGIQTISFNEFLDMFLPKEIDTSCSIKTNIFALNIPGIGRKRYFTIVKRLNDIDFGDDMNKEITNRSNLIVKYYAKAKLQII